MRLFGLGGLLFGTHAVTFGLGGGDVVAVPIVCLDGSTVATVSESGGLRLAVLLAGPIRWSTPLHGAALAGLHESGAVAGPPAFIGALAPRAWAAGTVLVGVVEVGAVVGLDPSALRGGLAPSPHLAGAIVAAAHGRGSLVPSPAVAGRIEHC